MVRNNARRPTISRSSPSPIVQVAHTQTPSASVDATGYKTNPGEAAVTLL